MRRLPYLAGSVAIALTVGGVRAQRATEPMAETRAPVVAIVGASVSAGFKDGPATGGSADNDTVPLHRVFKAWLQDVDGAVRSYADQMMFVRPQASGRTQVERTVKNAPDAVVAIDFLFWYGYGHVDARHAGGERGARLERLEAGLKQLQELACPVLVGDLPDMTGAARRMISPAQIPSPEALKALNERIAGWASGRANVRLFPLGALVARMKTQGVDLPLAAGARRVPPGGMLQGDRLHANRLGMAWLGLLLQDELAAVGALPQAPKWTLDQFVAAAGAEDELAGLPRDGEGAAEAGPAKVDRPAGGTGGR